MPKSIDASTVVLPNGSVLDLTVRMCPCTFGISDSNNGDYNLYVNLPLNYDQANTLRAITSGTDLINFLYTVYPGQKFIASTTQLKNTDDKVIAIRPQSDRIRLILDKEPNWGANLMPYAITALSIDVLYM